MTTPFTKLIADNMWRPFSEANRDGRIYYIKCVDKDGSYWQQESCICEDCLDGLNVTHFRPLPDDRLARAFEVVLEVFANSSLHTNPYIVKNALERATAIAERKE